MTQAEIKAMPREEFLAVDPFEKKSCADCAHCIAVRSWWCTNKDAIEARGTSFPGVILCPFWSPRWSDIPAKYRTPENGYVPPVQKAKRWWNSLIEKILK